MKIYKEMLSISQTIR